MKFCPDGFFCFDNNTILILTLLIIIIVVYFIRKDNDKFSEIKKALLLSKSEYDNKLNSLNSAENEMISDIEYQNLKDMSRLTNPLEPPQRSYPYRINSRGMPINYPTRGLPSGYQQIGILIQETPSSFFSFGSGGSLFFSQPSSQPQYQQPMIHNQIQIQQPSNIPTQKPSEKPSEKSSEKPIDITKPTTTVSTQPTVEQMSTPEPEKVNKEQVKEEVKEEKENIEEGFVNYMSDNNKKILPLFGQETYQGSNKWNYYTMNDSGFGVKLPISYKNRDCQDEYGCQEIYDGDTVKISGLNGVYKAQIYKLDGPRYIPFF